MTNRDSPALSLAEGKTVEDPDHIVIGDANKRQGISLDEKGDFF